MQEQQVWKGEMNLQNNKAFLKFLEMRTAQPIRSDAAYERIYHLIVTKKSSQITKLTQTIKETLQVMLIKFGAQEERQFACKRRIDSDLNLTQKRAYICYDCKEEDDVVICEQCFQKQKHIGHRYQQIEVLERYCDCGDQNYWKVDGFCSKHSSKKISKQISTSEQTHFLNFFRKCLDLIVQFYDAYEFAVNNDKYLKTKQQQKILKRHLTANIDVLISQFFNKLIQLNRKRQTLDKATIKLLETEYDLLYDETVNQRCSMKQIYFKFIGFQKAILQGYDLFNLLFIKNQEFKKWCTIKYIELISQKAKFYLSNYNKFSQSLLTSSKIITDLIKNRQIKILSFTPFQNPYKNPKEPQLERYLQSLGKAYKNYSENCLLLTRLKPQAFQAYWRYFSQQDGFLQLANYFSIFIKDPASLQILNQKLCYLQQYPTLLCFAVIKKVEHSKQCLICYNLRFAAKNLLKNESINETASDNNYFLNKLRIWTTFLFGYFFKCSLIASANELANNKKLIQDLLKLINIEQASFSSYLQRIFQILLHKLWNLCMRVSSKNQFTSHQNSYFKSTLSNNNLLRLDFFLIKFIVIYFQKYKKDKPIYNQSITKLLKDIFSKIYGTYEQKLKQNKKQSQTTIKDLEQKIQAITFFVGTVNQAIVSDINQLIIFSLIRGKIKPQQKTMGNYKTLYKRVLNSIQSCQHQINSKTFKDIFHKLFFQDEQLELECIKADKFFIRQKYLNLSYLYSLFFKIKQQEHFNSFDKIHQKINYQIETSTYGHSLMVDAYYKNIFPKMCRQILPKYNYKITTHLQMQAQMFFSFYGEYYIEQYNSIRQIFSSNSINQHSSLKKWKKYRSILTLYGELSEVCVSRTDHLEIKKEKFCVLDDQCENTESQDFLMLSFVFYSNSHGSFGIDQTQRILCFDACGHYSHLKCLNKLMKQENQVKQCPQCHSKWNFAFPCQSKTTTNKQFERLRQIVGQTSSVKAELLKSLVFYLTRFLSIDELDFLYKSTEAYRYIHSMLKVMMKQNKGLKNCASYKLSQSASNQQILINRLISSVLLQENYSPNNMIKNPQMEAIQMMVQFLQIEKDNKLKIPNKNYFRRDKILEDIWLYLLPQKLKYLFQHDYECRQCSKQGAYSYLMCLLPHQEKKDQRWCLCQNCANQNKILQHIKQHHCKEDIKEKYRKKGKGGIWIETHSGQVVYHLFEMNFGEIKSNKLQFCQYRAGSLYAKDKHIAYRLQKGYNKADFVRSDKFISTELNRIHSCCFQSKAKVIPKLKSQ